MIVQACYIKLKAAAQKAGFQYTNLNIQNIHEYIDNYEENVVKVRERSYQTAVQHFADLIRFYIIQKYGGVWVDISTVLLDDFTWLQNIMDPKYQNWITNRFSQQPDVLLFYFSKYQNSVEKIIPHPYQQNKTILFNEYPGYEIWFFAAKKNSSLMKEIRETYAEFTQTYFPLIEDKFSAQDIYMSFQDNGPYLSGNMAISYVLQRRQKQLDTNRGYFEKRISSFQHYKLWSLNALFGPLSWTNFYSVNLGDYLQQPKQQFQKKGINLYFFIKMIAGIRQYISMKLDVLKQIFSKRSLTFQDFLKTNPTRQECQNTKFVVKDSIVDRIFEGTAFLKQDNITALSNQEFKKWQQYCSMFGFNNGGGLFDSLFYNYEAIIEWFSIEQTVNNEQMTNSKGIQWLGLKLYYNRYFFFVLLAFFIDALLVCSLLYITFYLVDRLFKKQKPSNDQISESNKVNIDENPKQVHENLTCIKIFAQIVVMVSLNIGTFMLIFVYGHHNQEWLIFWLVFMTFAIKNDIQNEKNRLYSHGRFSVVFVLYDYLILFITSTNSYILLSIFEKHKFKLFVNTIIIGIVKEVLIKLLKIFRRKFARKNINKAACASKQQSKTIRILDMVCFIETQHFNFCNVLIFKLYQFFILAGVFIVCSMQSIKYMIFFNNYVILYLPYFASAYVVALYLLLLYAMFQHGHSFEAIRLVALGLYAYLVISLFLTLFNYNIIDWDKRVPIFIVSVMLFQTFYVQSGNQLIEHSNQVHQRHEEQKQVQVQNQIVEQDKLKDGFFSKKRFLQNMYVKLILNYGIVIVVCCLEAFVYNFQPEPFRTRMLLISIGLTNAVILLSRHVIYSRQNNHKNINVLDNEYIHLKSMSETEV